MILDTLALYVGYAVIVVGTLSLSAGLMIVSIDFAVRQYLGWRQWWPAFRTFLAIKVAEERHAREIKEGANK